MATKILAIDTALDACSVALKINNSIQEAFILAPRQQTQLIIPMIEKILAEHNIKLNQLDALAFSAGPASFTGLRIASSVIQGIAFANNLPVVLISTLQTIAQGAWRELKAPRVAVAVDAHMQEIYFGYYQLDSTNIMRAVVPDQLIKPEQFAINFSDHWFAVGNGWDVYQAILFSRITTPPDNLDLSRQPHAQDVALLAADAFAKGNFVTADAALPTYLRGAEAWKKHNQ